MIDAIIIVSGLFVLAYAIAMVVCVTGYIQSLGRLVEIYGDSIHKLEDRVNELEEAVSEIEDEVAPFSATELYDDSDDEWLIADNADWWKGEQ
jgi:hypothetical protein